MKNLLKIVAAKNIVNGPLTSLVGLILLIIAAIGLIWFELGYELGSFLITIALLLLGINEKDLKSKKNKDNG